ncbi:hypothetical protein CTI12_AA514440 [Artemisia annua]|uniref:Uncharacterized protein n=1 Tax=Artemisia annua TaxID=35608 RepID=A0A2U1L9X2_ARTAN|nr:hypothetical protein CTI12_AA514440 [Artemisia annua]
MAGSIDVMLRDLKLDTVESLPDDFDPTTVINDILPPVAIDAKLVNGIEKPREIVLGRNVHTSSLEVTELDAEDEVTGEREAYMASVLARYRKSLLERTKHHLGYPYNLDFDYGALSQLQHFSINNLGDPFIESNYGVHSRQFEVGVLDWFARLWELEKNEYWGYITNCGTEGNFHGILVGFVATLYFTHLSGFFTVHTRMYQMDCEKVNTLISGEIACEDFKARLSLHKDKPAIVNVNIGTTVKGAVDDLDLVIKTLEESGFSHDRFYIHCDGALFGLMMPFVKLGRLTEAGIGAMLNELSSTVVFERPQDEEFTRKWQLACQGNIAHVVVMPNINIDKLDDFVNELIERRAVWYENGKLTSPCVASEIGRKGMLGLSHWLKMSNSNKGYVLMPKGVYLSKKQFPDKEPEISYMQGQPYASTVGGLSCMLCYVDVAYAISLTSRCQTNLGVKHWGAVKNIHKYFRRNKDAMLTFGGGQEKELKVVDHIDASFQSDKDDFKLQSHFVFMLYGGVNSLRSAKHSTIVDSTTEAEYIAASDATEAV